MPRFMKMSVVDDTFAPTAPGPTKYRSRNAAVEGSKRMSRGVPATARAYVRLRAATFPSCSVPFAW